MERDHAPAPWQEQAARVAAVCTDSIPDLLGVYVHGSAALGGFTPASDLDVLVVAGRSDGTRDDVTDWPAVGRRLLAEANAPVPLELSVVAADDAAAPEAPWPFLVHVAGTEQRNVPGDVAGDPDLVAHYAVVRAAGVPVLGPRPSTVIGDVSRRAVLEHLTTELAWGLDHADQRYAVLNACRALAVVEDGVMLSKTSGASWWQSRHGASPLVTEALRAQQAGRDLGPCTATARTFAQGVVDAIDRALAR